MANCICTGSQNILAVIQPTKSLEFHSDNLKKLVKMLYYTVCKDSDCGVARFYSILFDE